MKSLLSALLLAVSFAAPAFAASDVVTIYAADGLHDGKGSWFETQFDAFTKATGIKVQYVEGGSGGVVPATKRADENRSAELGRVGFPDHCFHHSETTASGIRA